MGYAAVGFGPGDLRIDLLPIVINIDQATNPLVSANVALGDFNSGLTKLYKVVEAGGMRIGITTVIGKKEIAGRKEVGDFTLLEPYQAIPRILGELRKRNATTWCCWRTPNRTRPRTLLGGFLSSIG